MDSMSENKAVLLELSFHCTRKKNTPGHRRVFHCEFLWLLALISLAIYTYICRIPHIWIILISKYIFFPCHRALPSSLRLDFVIFYFFFSFFIFVIYLAIFFFCMYLGITFKWKMWKKDKRYVKKKGKMWFTKLNCMCLYDDFVCAVHVWMGDCLENI